MEFYEYSAQYCDGGTPRNVVLNLLGGRNYFPLHINLWILSRLVAITYLI